MILFLKGFFTKYKNIIFNIFLLFMLSYNIFYNRVFGVIVVSFILLIQLGKKHKKIKKYIDQYEEDKAIKQYHLAKDFSLFNYVFSFSQLFLFFFIFHIFSLIYIRLYAIFTK